MTKVKPIKQLILESKRQQEKKSERRRIVARFQDFLEYTDKLKTLGRRCKYLMLTGGSFEEVGACVEYFTDSSFHNYMEEFCFGDVISLSCTDKDNETLKKEIDEFIKDKDNIAAFFGRTGTILQRNRDKKSNREPFCNYKLLILNDVSSVNKDVWLELAIEFKNSTLKPPFLVATVKSENWDS